MSTRISPPRKSPPGRTKKERRSWFTPGKEGKVVLATERQIPDEDVEILILNHFTGTPRLGFGKIRPGKSKTCKLIVRNPLDAEQEVIIEKFPHKKNFSIDHTQFVVSEKDELHLHITWTPAEAGNCREMILFKVDDIYRLQAYVYGVCEAPPTTKKVYIVKELYAFKRCVCF